MTTDRETTRIVRSWIAEGADRLPDRVLDAVLDQVPTTPQRRLRLPWRPFDMPTIAKLGGVAAAILLVTVLGFQLLPRAADIGTPAATPTPTPSPTPLPTVTFSPLGRMEGRVAPGTYRVGDPFRMPFTITFPSAWNRVAHETDGVALYRSDPVQYAPGLIVVSRIDQVFPDPCHPSAASPAPSGEPLGGDEIVAQLRSLAGFTAGPVSEVTLGGHPARSFVLSNEIPTEEATKCAGSPLDLWAGALGRNTTNQQSTDHIWVVDVDGVPVTIDLQSTSALTPAQAVTEAEQVVNSIQFEP